MTNQEGIGVAALGAGTPPPSAPELQQSGMLTLLDDILRRREAFFSEIFEGTNLHIRIRQFLFAIVTLSAIYGLTMGATALSVGWDRGGQQMLSSGIKVPLLYLLTLLVCYPVLFIILVLMGSKLSFVQTLALILLALTFNAVLLASFAPIVAFFSITGSSYAFIKLLHVLVMTFSGFWGMAALYQGLREMCEKSNLYPKRAVDILRVWILVFGFVGTQMAWSLRPFIGDPGSPFEIFRKGRDGNFYTAVANSAMDLVRSQTDTDRK
jgi:hypothetical protein